MKLSSKNIEEWTKIAPHQVINYTESDNTDNKGFPKNRKLGQVN